MLPEVGIFLPHNYMHIVHHSSRCCNTGQVEILDLQSTRAVALCPGFGADTPIFAFLLFHPTAWKSISAAEMEFSISSGPDAEQSRVLQHHGMLFSFKMQICLIHIFRQESQRKSRRSDLSDNIHLETGSHVIPHGRMQSQLFYTRVSLVWRRWCSSFELDKCCTILVIWGLLYMQSKIFGPSFHSLSICAYASDWCGWLALLLWRVANSLPEATAAIFLRGEIHCHYHKSSTICAIYPGDSEKCAFGCRRYML